MARWYRVFRSAVNCATPTVYCRSAWDSHPRDRVDVIGCARPARRVDDDENETCGSMGAFPRVHPGDDNASARRWFEDETPECEVIFARTLSAEDSYDLEEPFPSAIREAFDHPWSGITERAPAFGSAASNSLEGSVASRGQVLSRDPSAQNCLLGPSRILGLAHHLEVSEWRTVDCVL